MSARVAEGSNPKGGASPVVRDVDARAWLLRILAVAALLYLPSLRNGFVLDDVPQILLNRHIREWSFIWKSLGNNALWFVDPAHPPPVSYYRPLQNIWYALNFHLFGLQPAGWHAAMLALHLLNVWLVFRIALRLTADGDRGDCAAALGAAALFGLMPVHAEAIVFAAAIATPLSAAFELSAFEFYLRWRDAGGRPSRDLAISLGLFGAALLSYDCAAVFPGLIATHGFILGAGECHQTNQTDGQFRGRARAALESTWPYAIALAAYLVSRFWALGFLYRPNLGNHLSIAEAIFTIPAALASYTALLAIPWLAGPGHQLGFVSSVAALGFWLPTFGLLALCLAAFLILRPQPHHSLYLFCGAWIAIALSPILNLAALFPPAAIQDRYLYLPSVGFCILAADLAIGLVRMRPSWKIPLAAGAAGIVLLYAIPLISAENYWRNEVTVYSRFVNQAPKVAAYRGGLGMALLARGELSAARDQLETARKLAPNDAENLYDLAQVDDRLGDRTAAAQAMAKWLRHLPHPSPRDFTKVALFADAAGDVDGARADLANAATLPGGAIPADVARAQILYRHGDAKNAELKLRDLLRSAPEDGDVLAALGSMLAEEHRDSEALPFLMHAAALSPRDPDRHYEAATVLHRMGREREAREECARTLVDAPYDPNALALMAAIEHGDAAQ
ncbi:MAG TPA: hypothetical protein VMT58_01060 [Candidatus Binataceae bacterium]|nr:hypothetical protein [Candidatus Binataceae bacterium]